MDRCNCCFLCGNELCAICCSDEDALNKSYLYDDATFNFKDDDENCLFIIGFINTIVEIDDYDYTDLPRKL